MTSDISVNAIFDTKQKFQASLVQLTAVTAKDFRILKNRDTQFRAVCYSNKARKDWKDDESTCKWCVIAKPFVKGDPGGKWIVVDFFPQHTCSDCDSTRKRNYDTKMITEASNTVSNFIPSKKRVGSTQQLMVMIKESDGINLKKTHASNIVNSKSQNSVCVHLGQYLLLQTYFDFLREKDEEGTFLLETQMCTWNHSLNQFKRCYVCFSYVKEFWSRNGCTPLFAVDSKLVFLWFLHIFLVFLCFFSIIIDTRTDSRERISISNVNERLALVAVL